MVHIGQDLILDGEREVHVQDTDRLQQTAKVGIPDVNGIVWDAVWVETERFRKAGGRIMKKDCCKAFCEGPKGEFGNPLKEGSHTGIDCKIGYRHFPKTAHAAHNLIRNGGRHTICPRNPWKYDTVAEG